MSTDQPLTPDSVLPGLELDLAALNAYVAEAAPHLPAFHAAHQLKGGQSNPTYRLDHEDGHLVLRMRPVGIGPWAHAVDREYRVLAALTGTDVPVPAVHHYCDDESVLGGKFYVMDYLVGRVVDDARLPGFSRAERRAIYESFVDTVAALHRQDPVALGLGDFGKPADYARRQVALHSKQYRNVSRDTIEDLEWVMENLPDELGPNVRTTLVHGDLRIGNLMLHPTEPRVLALLDFEMCTLGDPFADAALLTISFHSPPNPQGHFDAAQAAELGIPREDELIERYVDQTGWDEFVDYDLMMAFNLFRYAATHYGIHIRGLNGHAVSADHAAYATTPGPFAARARRLLEDRRARREGAR